MPASFHKLRTVIAVGHHQYASAGLISQFGQ
ncbi:hypothetical protein swp_4452 [Shewanella piezotolerans WP3]|uniref:Uncharacterized protein n=1 Tax=Shewanella piezotolerans (strain WP3 / JCM 13877) TaxID=225849 RepID=B8CTI7_SHEPW|nr:hypothetical protein swp_4452 [Shewanella piezotolerans WP3]